jgi:hypothetical protein
MPAAPLKLGLSPAAKVLALVMLVRAHIAVDLLGGG